MKYLPLFPSVLTVRANTGSRASTRYFESSNLGTGGRTQEAEPVRGVLYNESGSLSENL